MQAEMLWKLHFNNVFLCIVYNVKKIYNVYLVSPYNKGNMVEDNGL